MGQATILAGKLFVDVPHGLLTPPSIDQIAIVPFDDLDGRTFWPSNVGSSTFRINISSIDLIDHTFSFEIISQAAVLPPQPIVIRWPL